MMFGGILKNGDDMNELDRLRARIVEQSAARSAPEPRPRKSTLMINVMLASLTLVVIVVAAVKFL